MRRAKKVITPKELESFEKLNWLSELWIDQQQIYVAFLTIVHKIEDRVFSNLIAEDEESEDENDNVANNSVEQTEQLLLQQVEQSFMSWNTQQWVNLLWKVIENAWPWSNQAVQNIQNLWTEFLFQNKLDQAQKCFQILITTCSWKKQFVRNYLWSIVNTWLIALRKGNYANAIENIEFVINYSNNAPEDTGVADIIAIAHSNYTVIMTEVKEKASQNLA